MRKMFKRSLNFLILLIAFPVADALAFKLRTQANCEVLNQEMAHWFQDSHAQPKSHREEAPLNRSIGPLKDQKVGWCFAYTAADMLTEASGLKVSGASIAKEYYGANLRAQIRTLFVDNKEGGITRHALNLSLEKPLCTEKDFSSTTLDSYSRVKTRSCRKIDLRLDDYRIKHYSATGYYDGHTLFRKLDDILRDGRIAGIEYDHVQLLKDKTNDSEQTKANHASTVVARYFDKSDSSCRYVIRNSFGKKCMKLDSKKTKCVDGYYSVTESQMNKLLIEVISLERK